MGIIDILNSCYMNRELSWLSFNERCLDEAGNPDVPLAERLTFASIFQSNLRETSIKVIAEGIETETEANLVKNLGADFVRFFFYAKPSENFQTLSEGSIREGI